MLPKTVTLSDNTPFLFWDCSLNVYSVSLLKFSIATPPEEGSHTARRTSPSSVVSYTRIYRLSAGAVHSIAVLLLPPVAFSPVIAAGGGVIFQNRRRLYDLSDFLQRHRFDPLIHKELYRLSINPERQSEPRYHWKGPGAAPLPSLTGKSMVFSSQPLVLPAE